MIYGHIPAPTIYDQNDEIDTLRTQLAAAEARAERLKVRADTFEAAYNIANRATFQAHGSHWDPTGGSGKGCLACQAARGAREQCDEILRSGLQQIAALADGAAECAEAIRALAKEAAK